MPDKITLKEVCRIVLRRNLQISEGWVNGAMCEVLTMTPNCILVCRIGFPSKKYSIPRTKQKIDIKGASYSILCSQFPVQLAYAVTVHRVQGLTVDKAIVLLNHNFFASGQAYVALSRVHTADNLTLWNYTPSAIKIAPYYKQLLQWCDSVDVIRSLPYDGPPVRYPDRQHDQISCTTIDELNDDLDTGCSSSAPIRMPNSHKSELGKLLYKSNILHITRYFIYHILHIIQGGNVLADGQANSSLLENFCGLPTPLIFRKKMCSHV